MGRYNDIWTRVKEFEELDKERKRKRREEKLNELELQKSEDKEIPIVDDSSLIEEVIEGEEDDESINWSTMDYRVVKEYTPPLFNPGEPNLSKNGALKKYKDRFSKYLTFVDSVKYIRSNKYCSILALATTSNVFLNIWGSRQNISNALKELQSIGLIKKYSDYYQTGICKQYYYYI